jgi:hypothetical protein
MRVFSAHFSTNHYFIFWFRVFGYGLLVSTMTPLFSERYGYRKVIRIFGVKFEFLRPPKS